MDTNTRKAEIMKAIAASLNELVTREAAQAHGVKFQSARIEALCDRLTDLHIQAYELDKEVR